jgi:catechol 2,3-dioxygenase-like lactoylglutathione lyase family enzyme
MDVTMTHVRLLVADDERCVRFYRDDLGLTTTFGDGTTGDVDLDAGDVTLAIRAGAEASAAVDDVAGPAAPRGRDAVALILRVPDVDAADADCRRVAGATDRPEWGIRTAHVRDPDGNRLEVNEPL